MRAHLAYGRDGLEVDIPDANPVSVLELPDVPVLADPAGAVVEALRGPTGSPPLSELAAGRRDAVIVISDHTRPVPNKPLVEAILGELAEAGLADSAVTVLVATGIHRPATEAELAEMLGEDLCRRVEIVNHAPRDLSTCDYLGDEAGAPIWVCRRYMEADLRVVTGLIEPHLLAGFSGGRKAVCPGLCALESLRVLHGAAILESPRARYGIVDGNPFHEAAVAVARRAGVDFMVNVTIDRHRRLTGVFAGDLEGAHAAGVAFCRRGSTVAFPRRAPIVVTTGGGYPLDTSFYQSCKGLLAALPVVAEGGTIILATACSTVGSADFEGLLAESASGPQLRSRLLEPGFFRPDQWMAHHLTHVLEEAEVLCYAGNLEPATVDSLLVRSAPSVQDALAGALRRHGPGASVAVIPDGPYVLAEAEEARA